MFYNYNYLSEKRDNLLRLALFGSGAELAHKSRAVQENFQSKLWYSFVYFFSHAAHSDQVKRTFYNQRLPVLNIFSWQSEIH